MPHPPRFLPLLREYNRQRTKSLDEQIREEMVSVNPEEAHRVLVEHRRAASRVSADTITICGTKRRAAISAAKQPMLDAVLEIIRRRQKFWPLTDRQVHYGLFELRPLRHARKPDSKYANDKKSYKDLCDLLTRARLAGLIPYRAIHDPTRPVETWDFPRNVGVFIRGEMNNFLKGYYRDLMQSQPNHIEIIGEKNTIDNIIRPVAAEYCIPMTLGRGYCSIPPLYEMAQRFRQSGKSQLILLVLSDFDPEGEDIGHSFARSMRDDFNLPEPVAIKVALTWQQVQELGLPPMLKVKEKSSRAKAFRARHGDDVYEMEAAPPEWVQAALRSVIDGVLDAKAFNAEIDQEKQEAAQLDLVRRRVVEDLRRFNPEL